MRRLPKLKLIKPWGYPREEICDLEQAKYFLFDYGPEIQVTVDKELVHSYEELVQLVNQEPYRDKEIIEVEIWISVIPGG